MLSREVEKNVQIEDRMYVVRKFTALTGLKLGKMLIGKILPLAKDLLPSGDAEKTSEVKDFVANLDSLDSSILDKIDINTVIEMFEGIKDADLDRIAYTSLTNVKVYLDAGPVEVMDKRGFFLVPDIEYDPVLFIKVIWEQLKYGLSDFFKGDRWASLLPKKEEQTAGSDTAQQPTQTSTQTFSFQSQEDFGDSMNYGTEPTQSQTSSTPWSS